MEPRCISRSDRFFGEIDKAIKVLTVPARASRPIIAAQQETLLVESERAQSVRLMRVNHCGEVAAQALYQGQALTARQPAVRAAMQHAAAEELDHLAWCETRLKELKGRTSVMNPLWYASSFCLGALAGLAGDRTSLGFIAETERQVEAHLRSHMERISPADLRSRAIVEQMTRDEQQHGAAATSLGATELPRGISAAMRLTAAVMTHASFWL